MEIDIKVWLYDILNAINEIDGFFHDSPKTLEAFRQDIKTRRAVERNLGIIGEATYRILLRKEDIALTHARRIVDTRNRIIHGYDAVSDDIVWSIVTTHLPVLRKEVESLLGE